MIAAAVLVAWLTRPSWVIVPLILAAFFLWFFRDPERVIPSEPGAVVSPADGKVTSVATINVNGETFKSISIFLNVFDVHVNRTPIGGKIACVTYKKGQFVSANKEDASEANEQNVITVDGIIVGQPTRVVFKQIAGLIARRILCYVQPGSVVEAGQRIGLMKFGSRMDVFLGAEWEVLVKTGQRVAGGSDALARFKGAA